MLSRFERCGLGIELHVLGLSIIAKETWVLVNAWVFTTTVVGAHAGHIGMRLHAGRVGMRLHAGRIGMRLHAGRVGTRKPRQLVVLTRSSTRVRVRVGMRADTWGGTQTGMVGTCGAGGIGRRAGTWAATLARRAALLKPNECFIAMFTFIFEKSCIAMIFFMSREMLQ